MSFQHQFDHPLDQIYDQCYIFDDVQFAIVIRITDQMNVVITQVSQTYSNQQFNVEYIFHMLSIRPHLYHQPIDV